MAQTVDLSPVPAALMKSMRHVGYSLETALADILDNSITAEAAVISVQFRWNSGEPWVAICDDGHGMSAAALHDAMRFGSISGPGAARTAEDLGRFGLGLKTASLSQCKRVTVVSKQAGALNACAWDVDFLEACGEAAWRALVLSERELAADPVACKALAWLAAKPAGTVVLWQKLDQLSAPNLEGPEKHFNDLMDATRQHIERTFHRFLVAEQNHRALAIDFNGLACVGRNPFGKAVPARQELEAEEMKIRGQKVVIRPFILPHKNKLSKQAYADLGGDAGYAQNQGCYVYRNRRLIVEHQWFRLMPKTELTKLLRVQIDIPNTLDDCWQLDVKKSSVALPLEVRTRLKELLPALCESAKRPYKARGRRALPEKVINMWSREFKDGRVSYVMNEAHPFVKALVCDAKGEVDPKKLAYLRILSGAFPVEAFHVDVNDDEKTEIVSAAAQTEKEEAVRQLILFYRDELKRGSAEIATLLQKQELPLPEAEWKKLLQEAFHESK